MSFVIFISVTSIIISVIYIGIIAHEHKDKIYRREHNLPPRRYHDINDYDVKEIITIHYGDKKK